MKWSCDWKKILVQPDLKLYQAIELIEKNLSRAVLVVDNNDILLGILTDGDIRKALLQNICLRETAISAVMNKNPFTCPPDFSELKLLDEMESRNIGIIPILDKNGKIIDCHFMTELLANKKKINPVIVIAGGLGSRLGEMTQTIPKPLLKITNKPILQVLLEDLVNHGFVNFYFSVNYLSHLIEDHFGDGSRWGVNIQYLREKKKLGTAGPLSLIKETLEHPCLILNADLVTQVDYTGLLNFHRSYSSDFTVCLKVYEYSIPFGVVCLENHLIKDILEKPQYKAFISAGIYVINPSEFALVPKNQHFDIPQLIKTILMNPHKKVTGFPIHEFWKDIGDTKDFYSTKELLHTLT